MTSRPADLLTELGTLKTHCRSLPLVGLGLLARACLAMFLMGPSFGVHANSLGENGAWQFQTSTDKANQAAVQDMLLKRKSGYYAAPSYTTSIGRQFNCSVNATAKGNEGTASTVANSPSNSGATAHSTGNANATQTDGRNPSSSTSAQDNSGAVTSVLEGSTTNTLRGSATQTLDSNQANSGTQGAQVGSSQACAFGVLN